MGFVNRFCAIMMAFVSELSVMCLCSKFGDQVMKYKFGPNNLTTTFESFGDGVHFHLKVKYDTYIHRMCHSVGSLMHRIL